MKLFSRSTLLAAVITIALAACGGESKEDKLFGDGSDDGETGGASATIDPATAGTVSGTITFEGAPPLQTPADMSADQVCASGAGTNHPESTNEIVVTGGKLGNVFIYVSQGLEGKRFAPSGPAPLLDQQGCRYHPHVIGVMVGQEMVVKNSDPTLHNVHAKPKKNPEFNKGQATAGQTNKVTFEQEELMIPIQCDVHGWMKSYVGVLPHPCFAVSKTDGTFEFKAPPGSYTISAWHETLGTQEQKVTVPASGTQTVNFTFKAS